MATPKKLPSGSWNCLVYDYTDEKGKRHYKSITAPTKKECQFLAAEFSANKQRMSKNNLTVAEALEQYISIKKQVLSPTSIRSYDSMRRNRFSLLNNLPIQSLTNSDVQKWVNSLSKKLASKSVYDTYGYLIATLDMFAPEIRIKAKLPRKQKSDLYVPSDNDVKQVLALVEGTDLEIAILFAAFGPLRRGEICALTSDDIHGNSVTVSKSMVRDTHNHWVIKEPKTDSSYRTVIMPDFVIDKVKNIDGPIIKVKPDTLTEQFERLFKNIDVPKFRFHDLRHYSASIMHAIGIPDQYIMQRGGWSTDGVMKTVYRNTIDEQTKKMNSKINDYFNTMQDEMQNKN